LKSWESLELWLEWFTMFMESVRIIIDRGCQVRGRKSCHEFHLQLKIENACLNWQAIFWATSWTNGGRSEKSATWVFFRTDPFSFTQGDFSRKWLILGDFEDPLSTILAVAAGNEMFVSRNSPVAEMNLFCFLLILVYLNSEEFDCERGRWWSWDISLSDQIAAARIILGWINSIEEFLFLCLKSRPRARAGESIVWRRKEQDCCLISLRFKTVSCQ